MSTVLDRDAEEVVDEIAHAMPNWFEKLNLYVGSGAIGFSVIALNSSYTEIVAWSFFIVVFLIVMAVKHHFPPHIKELKRKHNRSNLENVVLKGVYSHFLGFRGSFFSLLLYWFGLCFLFAVANGFKVLFLQEILPLLS